MGSSIKYVCTLAEEGKLLVDVRCVLHVKGKKKYIYIYIHVYIKWPGGEGVQINLKLIFTCI